MAPSDFGGKVALVTGGGSGIGRETCLQLARDGARVVVTDINLEGARHTLSLLPGGGAHLALQMDVTQKSSVEAAFAAVKEKFGASPRLLVNSAGILNLAPFVDLTLEKMCAMMDIHVKGTFLVSQVFTRALLDEGLEVKEGKGAVVNISGGLGKTGCPDGSHYAAAKGAIISLTKSCASELASKGIRVNCVLPGLLDTPMTHARLEEFLRNPSWTSPLGRAGKPEEVAEVIVFLLSERSSYMVGACVEVTGGQSM